MQLFYSHFALLNFESPLLQPLLVHILVPLIICYFAIYVIIKAHLPRQLSHQVFVMLGFPLLLDASNLLLSELVSCLLTFLLLILALLAQCRQFGLLLFELSNQLLALLFLLDLLRLILQLVLV